MIISLLLLVFTAGCSKQQAADVPASGIDGDAVVLFPDTMLSSWGICEKHVAK